MKRTTWLNSFLAACLVATSWQASLRAADDNMPADGAAPRKVDQRFMQGLKEIINHGADLYNSGDRNACYHLFEGALMATRAQLEQFPDLQKTIDDGLKEAGTHAQIGQRAFALRAVLVEVRQRVGGQVAKKPDTEEPPSKPVAKTEDDPPPAKPAAPKAAGKTLWDRLGGEAGVSKVVGEFVDAAKDDAKINFDRDGKYKIDDEKLAVLKKQLVAFVSSAAGGPIKYTGKSMKESHKGMGISNEEFDAAGALLKKTLEENNVKAEDMAALLTAVGTTRKDIVEAKKPDDKEDEDKKPDAKKPDAKKPADKEDMDEDKKPDAKKPGAKKPADKEDMDEDKKPDAKKPDAKKPADKDDADEDKKPDAKKPDAKKPADKDDEK